MKRLGTLWRYKAIWESGTKELFHAAKPRTSQTEELHHTGTRNLRFTSLIEDFVICRYLVTKLFCTRYSFASSLWIWTPLSYDVLDLSRENCVLVQAFLVLFKLSVKSCNQKGTSADGCFASCLSSLKDFCPSFLVASSSLRLGVSVVFANLSWRYDCRRFLEKLHGYEQI